MFRIFVALILVPVVAFATTSSTSDTTSYTGDASTTAFSYTFPTTATSDLVVTLRTISDGSETVMVLGTNYTATAGDSGGTVTTTSSPLGTHPIPATEEIHIHRVTPKTQAVDLQIGGTFDPEVLEDAYDKLTKIAVELFNRKVLLLPKTDPVPGEMPDAVSRADKYLAFDSSGDPIASVGTSDETVHTSFGGSLAGAADANAVKTLLGPLFKVVNLSAAGPTDNVDVDSPTGFTLINLDTSGGNVTLGGTTEADPNDHLIVWKSSSSNTATIEHVEGGGSQDFYLFGGQDESATALGWAWTFRYNGTSDRWEELSGDGISVGTNPTVSTLGDLSVDTNGGGEPNSISMRVSSGTGEQYLLADTARQFTITVTDADNLADPDFLMVWVNDTGFSFTITEWQGWSNADDTSLVLKEMTDLTDATVSTTIDAVEIATDSTGIYTGSDTVISNPVIESGSAIFIDFDQVDDTDRITLLIKGYFNADVP